VEIMENWQKVTNLSLFLKWKYKSSPYRVIADLEKERGHWRALFTSAYGGDSYLIKGNCGSGEAGMMKAVVAAKQFMQENPNGCPPPGEHPL
jgi:hypothetical protein